MKFLHEYRDSALGWSVGESIAREVDPARQYRLMLFSGGLSQAVVRYGLEALLPENVHLLHGPGCAACALPAERIDQALWLARRPNAMLCVFPDILPARGTQRMSLAQARMVGANILTIRSAQAALQQARRYPDRCVVLFATGAESAAIGTALALRAARAEKLGNFFVLCAHNLTPPAIRAVMGDGTEGGKRDNARIDAAIAPGDVASVIGAAPFANLARRIRRPIAISGEEPLDLLQSAWLMVRRINQGNVTVENQFARASDLVGNPRAQALLIEVFDVIEKFYWPKLGDIPGSTLSIAADYKSFDAEEGFALPDSKTQPAAGCRGHDILRGVARPQDCELFGTTCTPQLPAGPCMVSPSAPCGAHWQALLKPDGNDAGQNRQLPTVARLASGDVVIVSGALGNDGIAALSRRSGIAFGTDVEREGLPQYEMVETVRRTCRSATVIGDWMPGGVAATLNEAIAGSGLGILLQESAIPQDEQVEAACELLEMDVLHLETSGRLIVIVPSDDADAVLAAMRSIPCGVHAAPIGRVVEDPHHRVLLQGSFGGVRVVRKRPAGTDVLTA
jgi:hydrogenase expression/formation protein HypD